MDRETLDALLKDEYLFLQKTYEDFDQRALLIKGWSVTVALGGLGLGFQYARPALWGVAGVAGLLFWVLEAMWKSFQYSFGARIQKIEAHFRGEEGEASMSPFQIYSEWFATYQSSPFLIDLARTAFLPLVCVPHSMLVIAAAVLLVLNYVFKVKLV